MDATICIKGGSRIFGDWFLIIIIIIQEFKKAKPVNPDPMLQ